MPDGTPGNTGNRVGLAVATDPAGPFEDRGPVVGHPSLDGSPFRDAEGALWLYYTAEYGSEDGIVPGRIYVDRLLEPDRVAGEPREVLGLHSWQEAPCALARAGRYFLCYSVGNWRDDSYHVRWALGEAPSGPFEEQPGALLSGTERVKGPGHHNFFRAEDGSEWLAYHGWDPGFRARYPRIDPLLWDEDRPRCPGPTTDPRPLPATYHEGQSPASQQS
jgi:beta-xylosidase